MKATQVIPAFVLLLLLVIPALPGRSTLAAAARAVDEGRPQEAVDLLTADQPLPPSPEALYDLGCAWQAQGQPAAAIAAWRAALELSPRDGDIAHNLALARLALNNPVPPVPVPLTWMAMVSVGELSFLATLLTALASWAAVRQLRSPSPTASRLPLAAVTASAVLTTALALQGRHAKLDHPVVVAPEEVAVRAGPDFLEAVRFELPAGAEVRVARSAGAFTLIEDGRGRRGWVVREAMAWPP